METVLISFSFSLAAVLGVLKCISSYWDVCLREWALCAKVSGIASKTKTDETKLNIKTFIIVGLVAGLFQLAVSNELTA